MGKIYLFVILNMCFVVFCFGITGCSKSSVNDVITQNQTSEIELYDTKNYINYLKKIWIVEDWDGGAYQYPSFFISDIKDNEIKGRYSTDTIAQPYFYFYSFSPPKYLGELSGTLKDNLAYLTFLDEDGNMGNMVLAFKEDNKIEATIEYTKKEDYYKDIELDGNFVFVPYNISNLKEFKQIHECSFSIDLNSWGNINFVTGEIDTGDKIHPVVYLTDEQGDILYVFDAPFQIGTRISNAKIEDVNQDGLKDITIITKFIEDNEIEPIEWIFIQKEDGTFYSNLLDED